jgi:hypothetical protein
MTLHDGQNRKEAAAKVSELRQKKWQLYIELSHAVQTGIAWTIAADHPEVPDINKDTNLCEHKHLRTGIDTSKSDFGALAKLLIDKKVINEDEYLDYLLAFMQSEKESYEKKLSEHFKKEISLG